MKSTTLFKTLGASLIILLLVGGLGYVSVSRLKYNAQLIVGDTLPGLTYAGAANATLAAAYNNLLLFLTCDNPADRARYRRVISEISDETTQNLDHYSKSIFDAPEDQYNFANLVKKRETYLNIRASVMSLAEQGNNADALREFRENLAPAYEAYRAAGETLLHYNIKLGEYRGREITAICNLTQVFVAFIGVFLFIAGFIFGLFR